MAHLTLKCRRHKASNCLRGCRKPSRGTRLAAASDYGYFDPSNVLTTYLINGLYRGSVEVQAETDSYQEAPTSFTEPFSYGSSYGGGDFGGGSSSSSDSGSSSGSSSDSSW